MQIKMIPKIKKIMKSLRVNKLNKTLKNKKRKISLLLMSKEIIKVALTSLKIQSQVCLVQVKRIIFSLIV